MNALRGIITVLLVAVFAAGCEDGKLKIEKVEPSSFKSGEAVMLDISGSGFQEGVRVWVGDHECPEAKVSSKKRVIALAPTALGGGKHELRAMNPDGKSATLAKALEVKSSLKLTRVKPARVRHKGRKASVLVKGQGFQKGCKVYFGIVPSPEVEFKDAFNLVARLPSLQKGVHDVRVETPDGKDAYLYNSFQVLSPRQKLSLDEFEAESLGHSENHRHQQGVAVADFNQDGLLDFFLTSEPKPRLFINEGDGKWRDLIEEEDLEIRAAYGAYFGDFDNDGFPDLLTTGRPANLYRNVKGKKLENVSEQMRIDREKLIFSAAWGDYNADGLLDLHLGSAKSNDFFYENKGDKFERVFTDVTEKMTIANEMGNNQPTSFSSAFADYDNDGYCDLFVGIRAQPSMLLHNEQGRDLENVIESSGLVIKKIASGKERYVYSLDWGSAFADVNNDGLLDLLSLSGSDLNLYMNNGNGTFKDITELSGLKVGQFSLGPAWGDFDNDGYQDLAITDNLSGARIFRNLGDGSFKDVTSEVGLSNSISTPMGAAWADINGDGALDLIMSNFMGASRIYINSPYPGRHYLKVRLEGTRSNRMGIGSLVRVFADDRSWTRHVSGGEGNMSHPPALLHFGLGEAEKVDRIEVVWPGGELQKVDDIEVDSTVKITQPDKPPEKGN